MATLVFDRGAAESYEQQLSDVENRVVKKYARRLLVEQKRVHKTNKQNVSLLIFIAHYYFVRFVAVSFRVLYMSQQNLGDYRMLTFYQHA